MCANFPSQEQSDTAFQKIQLKRTRATKRKLFVLNDTIQFKRELFWKHASSIETDARKNSSHKWTRKVMMT